MNISGTGFVAAEIMMYLALTAVAAFVAGWLTAKLFAVADDDNTKAMFEGARKELLSVNGILQREREALAAMKKELDAIKVAAKKKAAAQ